jgi:3-hydroxy-3-methylglutaryl CoA synthase
MAGATVKVKKKQQAEAAALATAAAQLNEGKQILAENAQKLGEMSDTTDEMREQSQAFASGIAALSQKVPLVKATCHAAHSTTSVFHFPLD